MLPLPAAVVRRSLPWFEKGPIFFWSISRCPGWMGENFSVGCENWPQMLRSLS